MSADNKTLYQLVTERVDMARAKVEELREKLTEFDAQQQVAAGKEKAAAVLSQTLDQAQAAIADLATHAQALKDNATEVPVRAFSDAFARTNTALVELKDRAKAFDEQHQLSTKLSDTIHNPREQAQVAIATASSFVTEAAHAAFSQLQGVSDGLKLKVMAVAQQGLDRVLPVAASYDEKLQLSQNAAMVQSAVTQHVKQFDEMYHVSDKLIDLDRRWAISQYFTSALVSLGSLDQRITGGNVQPAIASAYEMGLNMAGYVCDKYEETKAKVVAEAGSTTAPGEEAKAAPSQPEAEATKPAPQAADPAANKD